MGLLGFCPWAVAEHLDRGFGNQWIDSGKLDGVRENMLGSCFGVSGVFLQSITGAQHGMGRLCLSEQDPVLPAKLVVWGANGELVAGHLSSTSHSQGIAALDLVSGLESSGCFLFENKPYGSPYSLCPECPQDCQAFPSRAEMRIRPQLCGLKVALAKSVSFLGGGHFHGFCLGYRCTKSLKVHKSAFSFPFGGS